MTEDLGKLFLRLGVGGLMLFQGAHRLLHGLDDVKSLVAANNLPDAAAYFVYFGEIAGPVLIVLGMFARVGAFLVALDVVALVVLGKLAQAAVLAPSGAYGLETEALYLFGALAILLIGPGTLSIGKGKFQ